MNLDDRLMFLDASHPNSNYPPIFEDPKVNRSNAKPGRDDFWKNDDPKNENDQTKVVELHHVQPYSLPASFTSFLFSVLLMDTSLGWFTTPVFSIKIKMFLCKFPWNQF